MLISSKNKKNNNSKNKSVKKNLKSQSKSKSHKRRNVKSTRKTRKNIRKIKNMKGGDDENVEWTEDDKDESKNIIIIKNKFNIDTKRTNLQNYFNNFLYKNSKTPNKTTVLFSIYTIEALIPKINNNILSIHKLLNPDVLSNLTTLDLTGTKIINHDNLMHICNLLKQTLTLKNLFLYQSFQDKYIYNLDDFKLFFQSLNNNNNNTLEVLDIRENNNFFTENKLEFYYYIYINLYNNNEQSTLSTIKFGNFKGISEYGIEDLSYYSDNNSIEKNYYISKFIVRLLAEMHNLFYEFKLTDYNTYINDKYKNQEYEDLCENILDVLIAGTLFINDDNGKGQINEKNKKYISIDIPEFIEVIKNIVEKNKTKANHSKQHIFLKKMPVLLAPSVKTSLSKTNISNNNAKTYLFKKFPRNSPLTVTTNSELKFGDIDNPITININIKIDKNKHGNDNNSNNKYSYEIDAAFTIPANTVFEIKQNEFDEQTFEVIFKQSAVDNISKLKEETDYYIKKQGDNAELSNIIFYFKPELTPEHMKNILSTCTISDS
jgi:hypothetical protein